MGHQEAAIHEIMSPVSGTKFWPPIIAAAIATLRQFTQRRAKSNPQISTLRTLDPETQALAESMVKSLNEAVLRDSQKPRPQHPKGDPEAVKKAMALEYLAQREADEAIARAAVR